jgi:hypothetical protein
MGTVAGVGLGGACAAIGVAMMTAASPATTGCTTHECDPTTYDFPHRLPDGTPAPLPDGAAAPRGFMIDENTFVTSSLADADAPWIGIPGNRTLTIWLPREVARRTPLALNCLVANGQTPNAPSAAGMGVTFTSVAGQLAEFGDLHTGDDGAFGGSFELKNATCQFEYYWCTVDFVPLDAAPSAMDAASAEAGADAGATSGDGALADAAAE